MKRIILVASCIALFSMACILEAQDFREGKVAREGFDLYYRMGGAGAPVAILSGGPGIDCDYLKPVAQEVARTNQAILIELRGTGRSIPPTINADTVNLKLYLSDLDALRNQLKIDRWTLLGHSAGGMFAMQYVMAHPEQVDRLVLVGSGAVATRFMKSHSDNAMMRLLPNERKELQNPNLSFGEAVRLSIPGSFFDRAKAAEMAALPPGKAPAKSIPAVPFPGRAALYLIDRPDSLQSIIISGQVAPPTNNPDEVPLQVFNKILGGVFTYRLNMNILEDKHGSYRAGTALMNSRGPQPFFAYTSVQTDKT